MRWKPPRGRGSRRREVAVRRLIAIVWAVTLGLTAGGFVSVSEAQAAASDVSCGETITTDTQLDSDLLNCPNNGIVIGADDVTLDLNGHIIDGDGTEFADCPPDEPCDIGVVDFDHHGVTIKGGRVREFGFGANVVGATDSRVSRLAFSNNLFSGLLVVDSSRSEFENVTAQANGLSTDFSGIAIFDSHELTIERNAVFENGDIGFFIEGLVDSRIVKSTISDNPEAGILFDGDGNRVSHNRVLRNGDGIAFSGNTNAITRNHVADAQGILEDGEIFGGFGISFEGGSHNLLARNNVTRAFSANIRLDAFAGATRGNVVRANMVRAAGVDGIQVNVEHVGSVINTLLDRNIAIGAGDDGIDVESPTTTLTRNVANRNRDLGIEAVPGVIDGGGNKAKGNGNPLQCRNVDCK
jgi:large repetitive protein